MRGSSGTLATSNGQTGELAKRALDLAGATCLLLLLAPLLALIALLIKVTSPGPVLYSGPRVGRHEQPFRIYKFRSMVVDAEQRGTWWTSTNDPRTTPPGRVLRRTSLDELPQLLNVIRGDMSLVGPRPAAFSQLDVYTSEQRHCRASVRPGITGMAQVRGRSTLSVEEAIRWDMHYARNGSLLLDLKILAATVPAVLFGRGTN